MKKTAVLALGGNAIIKAGEKGSIQQQFAHTHESLSPVTELIRMGYKLAITHGNGPQVGNMLRQQEAAEKEGIPALPLGLLNAATEGTMGFMIEQCLQNRLYAQQIDSRVITILSQVLVDKNDPSMLNPSKFVGSTYYSEAQAQKLAEELDWTLKEDAGKGWRRVVPSPYPKRIIPAHTIRALVQDGNIVIAVGGGGIPVYQDSDGSLKSIDAVIDKDFASMLLALDIGAELFVIITGVEKVCLDYGKPNQTELDTLSVSQARKYYDEGQFPAGSMGPKILAAIDFISKGGKEVLITSIDKVIDALGGKTGTRILPDF